MRHHRLTGGAGACAALILSACAGPAAELVPLSRVDIETLPPGAGCSFEREGDILLVAMLEDGVALVRTPDGLAGLAFRGEEMFDGGRFAPDGRGPVIQVAVTGPEIREDFLTGQAATLTVDGRGGGIEGEWVCGA